MRARCSVLRIGFSAVVLVIVALAAAVPIVIPQSTAQPSVRRPAGRLRPAPRTLVDGWFERSEGIAFSGEGRLFVTANRALWEVTTDGDVEWVADLYSNLGVAPIGERDVLVADFGPTNAFNHGPNDDGIVWRVTPEGDASIVGHGHGGEGPLSAARGRRYFVEESAASVGGVSPAGGALFFEGGVFAGAAWRFGFGADLAGAAATRHCCWRAALTARTPMKLKTTKAMA